MSKIWGIHRVDADDRRSPRKGVFIVRGFTAGKNDPDNLPVVEVSLILGFRSWRKRLRFLDYQNGVANVHVDYWFRLSYYVERRKGSSPWHACWGAAPVSEHLVATNRRVVLYKDAG